MKYVLVLGAGKSGKSVCNILAEKGLLPVLFDDSFITRENQKMWVKESEFIVVSPAIMENNEVVTFAKSLGKNVIGEIEFAFQNIFYPYQNIVGVTGTNGKTTTVTMLGNFLGVEAVVAGNIGTAWSSVLNLKKPNGILELSSFQLMTIREFKPNIACILNLAPDHIDAHGSIENYYNAKLKITQNLGYNDFLVLNFEDKELLKRTKQCNARKFYFGFDNPYNGCFVESNAIYLRDGGNTFFVADIEFLKNKLYHNILNLMASITILYLMNKNIYSLFYKIQTYEYESYRMNDCGKVLGLSVYNDSKATNVSACVGGLRSLDSYKSIALILGGIYKQESFESIFAFNNVKTFYVFGQSKNVIGDEGKRLGKENIKLFNTLKEMVDDIFANREGFDCVYFSPACASFDMFSGYEARGKAFDELIDKYRNMTH